MREIRCSVGCDANDNQAMTYDEFLRRKIRVEQDRGFEPILHNPKLFDWQRRVVQWAVRKGRCALFEDCGLGKTAQQIEWAHQVCCHTGRPVLILAPLAVAQQTVAEAVKFGHAVKHVREPEDVGDNGIYITNYDRLEKFEEIIARFAGVVLDESSILKAFTGKTRIYLTEVFSKTPYRLCCTATPSPNDWTELGQHADFLGIIKPAEMLATWFINDTFDTGTWRLKKHAEADFWRWVSSWAVCITKPSDIGGDDSGFALPPIEFEKIVLAGKEPESLEDIGRTGAISATDLRAEKRRTLNERAAAAVDAAAGDDPAIIWCDMNDEADALMDLLDPKDAVEVRGSDKPEHKERKLGMFSSGERRVIVTKPSIAGYGLNWQHCRRVIFVGITYSFEDFYQAVRRSWRFGQTQPVKVTVITTDTDQAVYEALQRKITQHATMQDQMRTAATSLEVESPIIMKTDLDVKTGDGWTVYHGDCVRAAESIESDSVGMSVFSPPFADLFTYSSDQQDMGNCKSMDEFMEHFDFLIGELMRVTMPGRECAVHCVDLLATKWKDGAIEFKDFSGAIATAFRRAGWLFHSRITIWKSPVTEMQRTKAHGLLYKTLCKDSASSRVGAPDYLLVFRKPGINPKPIAHTPEDLPLDLWQEYASPVWMTVNQSRVLNGSGARDQGDERHICPLQLDVIERALHLWSAPGDLIYSPFTGIGSEGYSAVKMGRRFIGSELKSSYFEQACENLAMAEVESRTLFSLLN